MAKRNDIKTILIIGAGPINIGQACEFDYSGTQACRVLKHTEGYRIILINSNPATFMTDHDNADVIYIKPINPYYVEEIIKIEKPDAILPTMGGQVALNCAMELVQNGVLDKYNVELIGVDYNTIQNAEDRGRFKDIVTKCGYKHAKSVIVISENEIQNALESIGLPAIIRPSFTLGGSGGGIAYNDAEFFSKIRDALKISPIGQVQIDQSLLGWKEYELEILCDKKGNNIVVCGIENVDPIGIHTGDSITVTPCITLRDKEYQYMRDASFKILRAVGMDSGGANVQFAINPDNGDCFVIEANPRVSRSSALASKATGYPIAKVAAQLSVGYSLDEIKNDYIGISASFEPTIDYTVVKIPRFNFDKFAISKELTTTMKSVGEVMGIGRSFSEAFQKAICSLEDSSSGFNSLIDDQQKLESLLTLSLPNRYLYIADALRLGFSIDKIVDLTKYEKWFVMQIAQIIECEKSIKLNKDLLSAKMLWYAKKIGFSDIYLASITNAKALAVRELRKSLNVTPVFKAVDSCAAEFQTTSNYFYSCYEGNIHSKAECESISSDRKKVILIGSGPNRIGQGIEFDYACVHAIRAIRKLGYEAIMINCNPETVSTDYDMSDKLYFSPLIEEYVLDVIDKERESGELVGAILQFGGQTPIKLCNALDKYGVTILGTSLDSIDLAEDRDRFNKMIAELNIYQPKGTIGYKISEVLDKANKLGYPVVARPSYILGGQAMSV
ncbi:MAG: carbamoyl-phosphate synthase large subunit, partial [Anaplasmataceae bacterium]|nr:carbamoyl-phosphate synthase large subunit [Anaplasmataceae bacterium]